MWNGGGGECRGNCDKWSVKGEVVLQLEDTVTSYIKDLLAYPSLTVRKQACKVVVLAGIAWASGRRLRPDSEQCQH